MKKRQNQGFTLVELIVVITILAILGTIAFISLQGYSKDARNSTRISDMKNVENVLELYRLNTNTYPIPDNAIGSTASGATETLYYTGNFGTNVHRAVQRISTIPTDPKDDTIFMGYSVTQNRKEYQLKYTMEVAQNSIMNSVYANSTEPRVRGTYNELYVLGENGNYYALPSLFADNIDLDNEATYSVGNQEVSFTATPLNVSSRDLVDTPETSYAIFGSALQTAYATATQLNTKGIYLALENTTDIESFANTIVAGGSISSTTPTNVCTTQPGYTNANFTAGIPSTQEEAWQNTNNTNACYYECTGGYTGNDCSVAPLIGWRALDSNCDIEDIVVGSQTWAGCNSTLGNGFEWGKQDDESNGTIASCYNYSGTNNATCTLGDISMASNTKANTWFTGTNINGDTEVDGIWGKLYTWANSSSACGIGYHVPSEIEWETLETTLTGTACRSANAWQCDGLGWKSNGAYNPDRRLVETLKFPLVGNRATNGTEFNSRGYYAFLWSSTLTAGNAYARLLLWSNSTVNRGSWDQLFGFSVRCIKD